MGLVAAQYQRMMMKLLPPGRLRRVLGNSFLASLFLGSADELERVDARARQVFDEADPRTAVELLPDYERELDITAEGDIPQRQATVTARHVARQRYRPVDLQNALAAVLGQNAADVVIIERTHADAVSLKDDREIFRFFVYRNPSLAGSYFLDAAQAIIDKIKPSHTKGYAIESTAFLYDSPTSLYDRDIYGA